MTRKLRYSLVLLGLTLYLPVQAMDMAKVNALAEQIKAGMVTHKVETATVPAPVAQKVESQAASVAEKTVAPAAETVKESLPVLEEEMPADETKSSHAVMSGNAVSEESLGLRKTDLYSEDSTTPEETKYTTAAPGTSKRFDRAYENAPPMIPHSVDGLLPITKGNNACLGCHMPDVAPSMNATPIPPSHFTNFRPMTKIGKDGKIIKEGVAITNTSDIKVVARQENKLYQGRFNCSQCHAPQADIKPLVGNSFEPDFRKPEEQHKSNLIDVINEGVE